MIIFLHLIILHLMAAGVETLECHEGVLVVEPRNPKIFTRRGHEATKSWYPRNDREIIDEQRRYETDILRLNLTSKAVCKDACMIHYNGKNFTFGCKTDAVKGESCTHVENCECRSPRCNNPNKLFCYTTRIDLSFPLLSVDKTATRPHICKGSVTPPKAEITNATYGTEAKCHEYFGYLSYEWFSSPDKKTAKAEIYRNYLRGIRKTLSDAPVVNCLIGCSIHIYGFAVNAGCDSNPLVQNTKGNECQGIANCYCTYRKSACNNIDYVMCEKNWMHSDIELDKIEGGKAAVCEALSKSYPDVSSKLVTMVTLGLIAASFH